MNLKNKPLICIVMGSASDEAIAKKAIEYLKLIEVPFAVRVASAHRTPDLLHEILEEYKDSVEVYIGIAGMSAALAGVMAGAMPSKLVIGVPVKSSDLVPDSLLSTVMMPPGVPVASVGLDAGKNAAIVACQALAIKYPEIGERLVEIFRVSAQKVRDADAKISATYNIHCD